jgi:hypothetical protein
MFTGFVFNKNLKYILYIIIFIMVVTPIGLFFNNLYVSTLHVFGGETDDEKIERLERNEKVIDNKIMNSKKEMKRTEIKTKVLSGIVVDTIKEKVTIQNDLNNAKKDLNKKIKVIHITKEKKKPPLTDKVDEIVDIKDTAKYKEVGVVLSNAMFDAYNKTMEVNR